MDMLSRVKEPADLRRMSSGELDELAAEIRRFLVNTVSQTGGHLGPNLGVVELTIALHRVFDSPRDALIFDTGHQSYVHKILTGRRDFSALRHEGGVSGYPSRAESEHDIVENSHASTALSWADGIARGRTLTGDHGHVVAIIGDGAMTGGMAWEALNNIAFYAKDADRPLVIVLNDNGRSYAPTIGGVVRRLDPVRRLDALRVNQSYENFLDWGKRTLRSSGKPGQLAYDALRSFKHGVKEFFIDAGIFDSLGMKYIGPVNGHDISELVEALELARDFGGPVVVHTITEKGRGYQPAESNTDDHFHAVGRIHPETGLPIAPSRFGWTAVFADEIVSLAKEDDSIVAVTAAMELPVGLGPLRTAFPDRVFDVGIAEQHAMTMAAGLAHTGLHPVVALYATFMNRAFDQLLMDVALHKEPVTIVLDRAGVTGDDGPSHNGMWDLSLASMVPGLHVAIPRDEQRLRERLRESVKLTTPSLIRYPKGAMPVPLPTLRTIAGADVVYETTDDDAARESSQAAPVVVVACGIMAHTAVEAATTLAESGTSSARPVQVLDPAWVLPLREDLVDYLTGAHAIVVVEDGLRDGGIGAELLLRLSDAGYSGRTKILGIDRHFILHAERARILEREHIDAAAIAAAITELA